MKTIDNNDLLNIIGGINITGVLVNSFTNAFKFIFDTGRYLGNAIRRISSNDLCPIK